MIQKENVPSTYCTSTLPEASQNKCALRTDLKHYIEQFHNNATVSPTKKRRDCWRLAVQAVEYKVSI